MTENHTKALEFLKEAQKLIQQEQDRHGLPENEDALKYVIDWAIPSVELAIEKKEAQQAEQTQRAYFKHCNLEIAALRRGY